MAVYKNKNRYHLLLFNFKVISLNVGSNFYPTDTNCSCLMLIFGVWLAYVIRDCRVSRPSRPSVIGTRSSLTEH